MIERPLIFAAHADDELAMAGTIWRMARAGAAVRVVLFTDGSEGYPRPEMKSEIVALRKREAAACDRVLGIRERVFLDEPDMGLQGSKRVVLRCLAEVRRIRPDVLFAHGPDDRHPDHRAAHRIVLDAQWQAGEPVCAELGAPWRVPVVYYYKGVGRELPRVDMDTTDVVYKRYEALATQESQHTLFATTRAELLARAEALRTSPERTTETFWLAEVNRWDRFVEAGEVSGRERPSGPAE